MAKLYNTENFQNLLEGFHTYYKHQRMVRPEHYRFKVHIEKGIRDIFREIEQMLGETTHGIILKDFGTIVPKDSLVEFNDGRFKKSIVIKNRYLFLFQKEWLSDYYKCVLQKDKRKKSKLNVVRVPKPYTINLHRKKVKKE